MRKRIGPGHLLPCISLVLLAACQTSETAGPSAASNPDSQQPTGKLSAPVEISYEFMAEPRLGQPLEIQLTARALRPDQAVALQVTAGEGLSLGTPAMLPTRTPRLDGGRLDRVVVTPLVEGRSFLNVLATVTVNGQPMHKAVAIPIQVGRVAAPLTEPDRDAGGTPIRSMPARETTD